MSEWIPYKLGDKVTFPCLVFHPTNGLSFALRYYSSGGLMSNDFCESWDREITLWMPIEKPSSESTTIKPQSTNDELLSVVKEMAEQFKQWKAEKQARPALPEVTAVMVASWYCKNGIITTYNDIADSVNQWIKENIK